MRALLTRFPVATFVLLTLGYQFAVVGLVGSMIPAGGGLHDNATAWMIFRFRVFGPLVFVVAITWYLERGPGLRKLFSAYFHWKVPGKWFLFALSWKFIFTYTGIALLALVGFRSWPGFVTPDTFGGDYSNLVQLIKSMPFLVGIALVEETAWMKFCVTRMQERYSALASCLIIGLAWGLWYLPMLLLGEGTPDGYPWPVFLLTMICLCILLGWTYNMTRSGLVLLIMQVVSNCAFFIVPVLPAWWGLDPTYVNAFVGVNVVCSITLVLVYGWRELGTRKRATWNEPKRVVRKRRHEEPGEERMLARA